MEEQAPEFVAPSTRTNLAFSPNSKAEGISDAGAANAAGLEHLRRNHICHVVYAI